MELTLKPWEKQDGEKLAEVFNGADRTFTSNRRPTPYPVEAAAAWLEQVTEKPETDGLFYAILADGEYAGFITVERMEDVHCRDAEIGYLLKREYEAKGITAWAVGEVCRKAFAAMDIVRITAYVFDKNIGSRHVLEKNGFVLEGIMKRALYKNGMVGDEYIYAKYRP